MVMQVSYINYYAPFIYLYYFFNTYQDQYSLQVHYTSQTFNSKNQTVQIFTQVQLPHWFPLVGHKT